MHDPLTYGHFVQRWRRPRLTRVTLMISCKILGTIFLFFIFLPYILLSFLVNDQTWSTILFYVFISILYMFRATSCSSSGESIVSIQHLVYVTLTVTVSCAGRKGTQKLGTMGVIVGRSEILQRTEQFNEHKSWLQFYYHYWTAFHDFLQFFSIDTAPNTIARGISSTAFLNLHSNRFTSPSNRYFSSLNEYHTTWKHKIHLNYR